MGYLSLRKVQINSQKYKVGLDFEFLNSQG
jgi:hypothetical protein